MGPRAEGGRGSAELTGLARSICIIRDGKVNRAGKMQRGARNYPFVRKRFSCLSDAGIPSVGKQKRIDAARCAIRRDFSFPSIDGLSGFL
jgi:hypothetical protein